MGWARTLLLGDIGNRLDIADTEKEIQQLRSSLRNRAQTDASQDEKIERLERDVEELDLCLSALSRLLLTRGVLTSAEVRKLADIIDGQTGDDASAT